MMEWRYISAPRSWSHEEYSCFDFPAHPMFTFDELWGSLGTGIFGNSNSAVNNTLFRLPSRLTLKQPKVFKNHTYFTLKSLKIIYSYKTVLGASSTNVFAEYLQKHTHVLEITLSYRQVCCIMLQTILGMGERTVLDRILILSLKSELK